MNAIGTNLKDVYIITNKKFVDDRGFFIEVLFVSNIYFSFEIYSNLYPTFHSKKSET